MESHFKTQQKRTYSLNVGATKEIHMVFGKFTRQNQMIVEL